MGDFLIEESFKCVFGDLLSGYSTIQLVWQTFVARPSRPMEYPLPDKILLESDTLLSLQTSLAEIGLALFSTQLLRSEARVLNYKTINQ